MKAAQLSFYIATITLPSTAFVPQLPRTPGSLYCPQEKSESYRTKERSILCMSVETDANEETQTSKTKANKKSQENNPRLSGLAFMLDDGTRKSHSMAQNSAFVTGFFKGLSTRTAYRSLLTSLYFVYVAMEDIFDHTNEPHIRALDDDELRRVSALEQDMDYFYGANWKDVIVPSTATRAYVARIKEISETQPYLLVAHQYTRYLGDLFGGQMMGGMATRSLELKDGKGVAFYQFEDISSTDKFITSWYSRLNELDLSDKQKGEIVDEANLVFDLNIGILEELDGSPLKALWTIALNTFKSKLGITHD